MRPRRPPRFDFETLLLFTPYGSEAPFTAFSVNLCEGGMLLRSEKRVTKGSVLEFCSARLAGECEVMWSHETDGGNLFGIRFASLGSRAQEELAKLLYEVEENPQAETG